jgi:integrase
MGHSQFDPAARERRAWNAGRIVGAKRALKPQQVWAIRFWLDRERRLRDRALFDFAVDSKLRGCDVVKVRIGDHISTRQYARLVDEWVTGIGLRCGDYGAHSLRRTKASIIYKATGNLRAVQILLGHSKIESTVRYLGVDVEDALHLAECTEI